MPKLKWKKLFSLKSNSKDDSIHDKNHPLHALPGSLCLTV